jgi:tetraacyldisaccharide-1-P 4'-kinase
LSRADVVVVTRTNLVENGGAVVDRVRELCPDSFVTSAELVVESVSRAGQAGALSPEILRGKRVTTFCGIANPGQFVRLVTKIGATVLASSEFPDHHHYRPSEIAGVINEMEELEAFAAVTTAKDWAKCQSIDHLGKVLILNVRFRPADRAGLLSRVSATARV